MDFKRYTSVIAADGSETITKNTAKASVTDMIIDGLLSPLKAFSDAGETELITKKEAGYQSAVMGATAGLVGELFGHKRERAGSPAILKFLDSK